MDNLFDALNLDDLADALSSAGIPTDGIVDAIDAVDISPLTDLENLSTIEVDDIGIDLNLDINLDDIPSIDYSNVSFEGKEPNLYDRRTADFLKECQKENYKLPNSVTHYDSHIDRSTYGGMQSIDKSIVKDQIERDFKNGKITNEAKDKLIRKLNGC